MPKKVAYSNITPIPSYIPRQLAIDMLHSHGEIIELNPLVIEHHPIKAPRDAPADEFFSTWHEITERIQYIPGTGKLGSGKISFKGVFHDMPWGLQTHIYAPAGVDLRNKWQIKGNQPGEAPEPRELGSAAPPDGLYLREDVEIKCNFTMIPFVKSSTKAASKVLVERMIKKAELIDAEILRQMMTAQKEREGEPNNASSAHSDRSSNSGRPLGSPGFPPAGIGSPNMTQSQPNNRNSILANSQVLRKREEALRQSMYLNDPRYRSGQWNPNDLQPQQPQQPQQYQQPNPNANEMIGSFPSQSQQQQQQQGYQSSGFAVEMPGDYYHPASRPPRPEITAHHSSTYSELSGDNNLQSHSRRSSNIPDTQTTSSGWGGSQTNSSPRLDGQGPAPGGYRYNPRDFSSET